MGGHDDPFEGLTVQTDPMWPGVVLLIILAALGLLAVVS